MVRRLQLIHTCSLQFFCFLHHRPVFKIRDKQELAIYYAMELETTRRSTASNQQIEEKGQLRRRELVVVVG
jgi:hypothetical protein